MNTGFYGL